MTKEEDIAREAIRRTINSYSIAGDKRDRESFARLFADYAVFEFAGYGPLPGFHCSGVAEIRERAASWSPVPGDDPSLSQTSFIRHNLTTSEITLTRPNTASARTYFVVVTEGGPDHSGIYSDEFIRQSGNWLFSRRRITLDWRSPASRFPPMPREQGRAHPDPHQANIDLMNRYAHALDVRDWALFASLFTEDASFAAREWGENAVPGPHFLTMDGRDTIVTSLQATWDGLSRTHHMLSNYTVDAAADGKSARASCYLRAHHVGNRERSHLFEESLGRFDFVTVLEGSAWKIRRMEENIMIMLGTAEAFAPPPA